MVCAGGEGGPASRVLGPLVHTVYSVRTTDHFQKNETCTCMNGHLSVHIVF